MISPDLKKRQSENAISNTTKIQKQSRKLENIQKKRFAKSTQIKYSRICGGEVFGFMGIAPYIYEWAAKRGLETEVFIFSIIMLIIIIILLFNIDIVIEQPTKGSLCKTCEYNSVRDEKIISIACSWYMPKRFIKFRHKKECPVETISNNIWLLD